MFFRSKWWDGWEVEVGGSGVFDVLETIEVEVGSEVGMVGMGFW